MRIKKDVLTQELTFVGIDSTDHITRKTGLSSFTVYYSLNGGAAAIMTTPTVAELDATNMAGDYTLLIDEAGMVSAAGELTLHITASGMDPVTRIVEITDNFEADIAGDVWDEVLSGATHNVSNSSGKRLREMFDAGLYEEETAQAGTASTITLAVSASAIDDFYNMMTLTIIEGTGEGQMRTFADYDGSSRVATACIDWSVTPDNTSKYVISAHACVGVFDMQTSVYDLINAEVDTAFNTAIPGSPTADSVNQRLKAIDELTEVSGSGDLTAILVDTGTTIPAQIDALEDITVADIIAGIADGTYDLQEMMRLIFSACCLKVSGGGTNTISFRDSADGKDRIIETVNSSGDRTAVTLDGE